MELILQSVLKKLPPLYSTKNTSSDKVKVPIHLFSPWGSFDCYIFEYDPAERVARAFIKMGGQEEIGLVSIDELESVRGPLGLKIERSVHWDANTKLSKYIECTFKQ